MGTLLDCFDRPATVRVRGITIRVPALTLGGLCDLQAWLRDQSWNPWDVPPVGSLSLVLACVAEDARGWPPPLWSRLAHAATDADAFADELAYVAFGRANGLGRPEAAAVGRWAREDYLPWREIMAHAHGERPEAVAGRILDDLDGAEAPEPDPVDWRLIVADLVMGTPWRRGLAFAEAEALTLPQLRLLRAAYRDEKGRPTIDADAGHVPGRRPGEPSRSAIARRNALLGEARAILEARYSGPGGPPEGEPDRDDGEAEAGGRIPAGQDAADQDGRQPDE